MNDSNLKNPSGTSLMQAGTVVAETRCIKQARGSCGSLQESSRSIGCFRDVTLSRQTWWGTALLIGPSDLIGT